jgi:pSer/pThr/pTyr-binding forkhead associated (FHA) protein
MSELIIQSGKLQGKRLVLPAKEMTVGRDEKCDLRIGSELVSRKHCTLKSTPEGIVVTDLGSQNGTHINDVPISGPTLLREGDILRIGATLLSVPATQRPKEAPNPAKVSDAEIADWLTDSGSNYSSTDTAVIPTYPPSTPPAPTAPAPAANAAAAARPAVAATASKTIPKVMSVKDEAAEIIRKHWEAVKAREKKL